MKITYQAITDVGKKRKGNEDSLFVNAEQNLFVVADGMGGHAAGEIASKVAVDAINEFVVLTSGDEEITWPFGLDENISYDGNRLKTAIRFANRKVLEATREKSEYEGMATTVAAVLVDGSSANLGARGRQPRLPRPRRASIEQLTSDHSWVNEQIQSGVISADQARSHPLRNVVTRALGGKPDLQVDMQVHKIEPGDVLLLCSDGLTTMIPDEDIARVVGEAGGDVEKAARALVAAANARGGEDNITSCSCASRPRWPRARPSPPPARLVWVRSDGTEVALRAAAPADARRARRGRRHPGRRAAGLPRPRPHRGARRRLRRPRPRLHEPDEGERRRGHRVHPPRRRRGPLRPREVPLRADRPAG